MKSKSLPPFSAVWMEEEEEEEGSKDQGFLRQFKTWRQTGKT